MDLSIYFQPINIETDKVDTSIGKTIHKHTEKDGFPIWEEAKVAVFGVMEERGADSHNGCAHAPDEVRKQLYLLDGSRFNCELVDLGNIIQGNTIEDTYFAVGNVIQQLIKKNVLPIIIGGSQDITFANYSAYQQLEQTVNLVCIDREFDLGKAEDLLSSRSFLSKIILNQPNFLFNYSNIGYQSYFVNKEAVDLMAKLFFDTFRLGSFTNNIQLAESITRNADLISFDVSAIRASDAPGQVNPSPNGFYADQACQMCKYAGMSDKLSSIGFYNYSPQFDRNNQTAQLVAQMIWYVIEGVDNRKDDFPIRNKKSYTRYRVMLEDNKYELIFYKSKKTDRWWMDVPYPPNKRLQYERHHLVPCAYADYQKALEDEMPDTWWKTYQKLI